MRVNLGEKSEWFGNASHEARWLVGVSGGADSVALLHLLVREGFRNLVVCHLNHGLRGEASDGDAEFVRSLAGELGLICEVGRVDVNELMTEHRESMETAARRARHEFLGTCAGRFSCGRVVLGHHADDQAETVLWNLMRGSHGLKGMREVTSFSTMSGGVLEIVRPLLGFHHADLVQWLVSEGRSWREDSSNAETLVVRNRLRHEVIPLLNDISGRDSAEMIGRALAGVQDLQEIEAWAVSKAGVLDPQGRLHVKALGGLPAALQRAVLVAYLRAAGVRDINHDLVKRILEMMEPGSASVVNLPGGCWIQRREGRVFVTELHQRK